jgi:putative membrane protein
MLRIGNTLIVLVAALHLGFLVLEMVYWDHPVGRRVFGMTPEQSASSAVLAMNQGLYNGFLAAGLAWGLLAGRRDVKLFFLACIVIAGIFGGITAKPTIVLIQALPALLAMGCVLAGSAPAASTQGNAPRPGH